MVCQVGSPPLPDVSIQHRQLLRSAHSPSLPQLPATPQDTSVSAASRSTPPPPFQPPQMSSSSWGAKKGTQLIVSLYTVIFPFYAVAMPRRPRKCSAGMCFHVLKRAVTPLILSDGPVPRPRQWRSHVTKSQTEAELASIRSSVTRGTPYGSEKWLTQSVARLQLKHTLRSRGRPRKHDNEGNGTVK